MGRAPSGLDVIIVTHDRVDLLQRTLDSLDQCSLPRVPVRGWVVNNSPTPLPDSVIDGAWQRQFPWQFLTSDSPAKTVALNLALTHCDDDDRLAVFFDDDIDVAPGILEAYHEAAQEEQPRYYGGPVDVRQEAPPDPRLLPFLPRSAKGWTLEEQEPLSRDERRWIWFLGFNWAANVGLLKEMGGFHTQFGPGTAYGMGDETLLQERMFEAGVDPCFVPEALATHYVPRSRCSLRWCRRRSAQASFVRGVMDEQKKNGQAKERPLCANLSVVKRYIDLDNLEQADQSSDARLVAQIHLARFMAYMRGWRQGMEHTPLKEWKGLPLPTESH